MKKLYSSETQQETADFIKRLFHVSDEYANRLAISALDGIESHGGNPNDIATIHATVEVVVATWVKDGALQ